MKCPACASPLSAVTAGEITVDVCKGGCGGAWFDDLQLKKCDEEREVAGSVIIASASGRKTVSHSGPRPCPKCSNELLFRRFYDVKNEVEVDQCLKCSGIWLDPGELEAIRGQHKTEAERLKAANGYLDSVLTEQMAALSEEHARDMAQIAKEGSSFSEGFKAATREVPGLDLDASPRHVTEGLSNLFRALFRGE